MQRRLLFALIIGLALYVAYPFLLPLIFGGILAILFVPVHRRLLVKGCHNGMSAMLVTLLVALVLLLPMSLTVFSVASKGFDQIETLRSSGGIESMTERLLNANQAQRIASAISRWFPVEVDDLMKSARDLLLRFGVVLAEGLKSFFVNLPAFLVGAVVTIVSLFFFLRDRSAFLDFLRRNSMLSPRDTNRIFERVAVMSRSVILASVLSACAQAVVFFIAMLIVATPNATLIALLVFFFSFVPLVGTVPVTVGTVLLTYTGDAYGAAVFLAIVAVLITLLDNVVRPVVLKGSANLHPLVAFVAAFGGLQMLGFSGIFLGPIIAGIFLAMVDIAREN